MKIILILFISMMTTTVHAETISEIRSRSIGRILDTPMLREFFKNEDGSMGSLARIEYSGSATEGTADQYKLTFSGKSGSTQIECVLLARVEGKSGGGDITFKTPQCMESQIVP